jgi:hypothetical protein
MRRESMRAKTALIIGGGKYGAKAGRYFKAHKARVILVDNDPDCKAKAFAARGDFFLMDAKDAWELALKLKPDFIAPTHPGHTLGKWIGEYFHLKPLAGPLEGVMKRLPQSLVLGCDEANAALVASYMTRGRLCREDCQPAPNKCALTGEPRPAPVYNLLEYAIFDRFDCGRIFAADQLAAGIGAIKAAEFLAFMNEVEIKKPKTLAVGTACRCHGVLNLFGK